MKNFLIAILSLSFAFTAIGQTLPDDSGFTNKAEAKNLMVNGVKEGKWVEYLIGNGITITDSNTIFKIQQNKFVRSPGAINEPNFYEFIIYRFGKPCGLVRKYSMEGELVEEIPYVKGIKNGVHKAYYKGKLFAEVLDSAGKATGVEKRYYLSGKLQSETTYNNGVMGKSKTYDENGNEIK